MKIRRCNRCRWPVGKSRSESEHEYPYECVKHDEDLFGIETFVTEEPADNFFDFLDHLDDEDLECYDEDIPIMLFVSQNGNFNELNKRKEWAKRCAANYGYL